MDYTKASKDDHPKKGDSKNTDERPVPTKVVVGEVKTRKRPLSARFRDTFLGAEVKQVAEYLAAEVLLPAMRNLIVDSATKGISKLVFGDDQPRSNLPTNYRPQTSYGRTVAYTNYSTQHNNHTPVVRSGYRGAIGRSGYEELVLATQRDARRVLDLMQGYIDNYNYVTVGDMKESAGIERTNLDDNWGWVYLNDAVIRQTHQGWVLELPNPDPLTERQ